MLKGLKATFDKGITAASVKSGALVDSSRTRTAITATQKRMDEELSALGVLYFNGWKSLRHVGSALRKACVERGGIVMKTCSKCGQSIKDSASFCPFCGAKALTVCAACASFV